MAQLQTGGFIPSTSIFTTPQTLDLRWTSHLALDMPQPLELRTAQKSWRPSAGAGRRVEEARRLHLRSCSPVAPFQLIHLVLYSSAFSGCGKRRFGNTSRAIDTFRFGQCQGQGRAAPMPTYETNN